MQEALYIDLIAKYLSGNINADEREKLLAWVAASNANRAYFDEIAQLWEASPEYDDAFTPPDEAGIEKAWMAVEQRVAGAGYTATIRHLSFGKVLLRAAAVILLLISATYWLWHSSESAGDDLVAISTGPGEKKTIELPDGSTVWLNEQSRLSYQTGFEQRQVSLEGEAFFEVRKANGKTFTIQSGDALTTVLGTSFNVRAYPAESNVEVAVKTGKVELKSSNSTDNKVLLKPGDTGIFEKSRQAVRTVESTNENSDAWKTRSLRFDNATVAEVISVLQRYFEVEIEVSNEAVLKCRFNMATQQNPELDHIFTLMDFTMAIKAKGQHKKFLLNGDGC